VASLAFVSDRTLTEPQESFGWVRPGKDGNLVELARVGIGHANRNLTLEQKAIEPIPSRPVGGKPRSGQRWRRSFGPGKTKRGLPRCGAA